jgi:hypothetical protein
MSKVAVSNYKLVLWEVNTKVADSGRTNQWSRDFVLYSAGRSLQQGRNSFETEVRIPQEVTGYSAIGNIFCRAYYFTLVAEVFCCFSNPTLLLHTILNTTLEPELSNNEKEAPPEGWRPLVAQPRVFANLPPYIYEPCR